MRAVLEGVKPNLGDLRVASYVSTDAGGWPMVSVFSRMCSIPIFCHYLISIHLPVCRL